MTNGVSFVEDQKPVPSSTEWETPAYFFEALHRIFDFNLDVAADEHNAKCETYYDKAVDALSQNWGEALDLLREPPRIRVWMNPPFAAGNVWVPRLCREVLTRPSVQLGVALVLNSTDTAWWHDTVMQHATRVWLVAGRIPFEYKGRAFGQNRYSNAVVLFERGHAGPPRFASVDALRPRF